MTHPATPPPTRDIASIHTTWRQRVLTPGVRSWLAVLLFVAVPFLAANVLTKLLLPEPDLRDLRNLIKTVVLTTAYWAYVHYSERRPVRELSVRSAASEILAGLLAGGLLFSSVVAVLATFGAYSIERVGSLANFGSVVASMLPKLVSGALIEELLFRLVLLRLLERSFGTAWALALSSLAFGLAHLGNVGATPLVGILLGMELGLLLGAAYLLTRRLWFCTALHLAWNFTQGAVFSIAVSGQSGDGWLLGRLDGPTWLTGGDFGAEGSVVAVVICLVATAVLLKRAQRRQAISEPGVAAAPGTA